MANFASADALALGSASLLAITRLRTRAMQPLDGATRGGGFTHRPAARGPGRPLTRPSLEPPHTACDRARMRARPFRGLVTFSLAALCGHLGCAPKPAQTAASSAPCTVEADTSPASDEHDVEPTHNPLTTAETQRPVTIADARDLAQRILVLDGHVDLPFRLEGLPDGTKLDLTRGESGGDFDLPRTRLGGLDAPFMSIYTPAKLEGTGKSKALADKLIDIVESLETRWPRHFRVARSTADVHAAFADGVIALPMGMENGSPIEKDIANLHHFYHRGIRYITLAHSRANHLSDSSYDENRPNGGLSSFGIRVVAEMNRLGIMVDVSHLSDDAFWDVMKHSAVPVIASHSSCRHFTPGFERNMSDEMIMAMAQRGGVIQINFGSTFIDHEVQAHSKKHRPKINAMLKEKGIESPWSPGARPHVERYNADNPGAYSTVERVADHIEHVVQIAGIDHVGLGSDFDGVGDSLPVGLKDVGEIPNLFRVLLERGFSESDIEKIASGNVLRVWTAAEQFARGKTPDADEQKPAPQAEIQVTDEPLKTAVR